MPSDHDLLERQMADVELPPFTLEEFHRRRHRKQRNRRIATAAMGLVLVAVVAGGVLQTLGQDDQSVDSTILGPSPSPFEGTWTSTDADGSSQTMEIRRTEGDEHEIVLHDDSAGPCLGTPSTETGSGQVRSVTELVVSVELSCDDGSTPTGGGGVADLTFVHDPETGELTDSIGVIWKRSAPGAPSEEGGAALEGSSPFEGSWVTDGTESVSAASMEISYLSDRNAFEIVMHGTDAIRCPGAGSTITGTGHRRTDDVDHPGFVELVVDAELTCDDGRAPVPKTPDEEGLLDSFRISFLHDPETDQMAGSLGGLWWRQGTERKADEGLINDYLEEQ